jgi:hypothetical protein
MIADWVRAGISALHLLWLRGRLAAKALREAQAAEVTLRKYQLHVEENESRWTWQRIDNAESQLLEYDLRLREAQFRWLLARASALGIPFDYGSAEREVALGRHVPTEHALRELEAAIRHELTERRSIWTQWLAAMTGFVGALIGLVALFKS